MAVETRKPKTDVKGIGCALKASPVFHCLIVWLAGIPASQEISGLQSCYKAGSKLMRGVFTFKQWLPFSDWF